MLLPPTTNTIMPTPKGFPEKQMTQIWLGSPGVSTHLHYDAFDNYYVGLRGKKRFVMLPPREAHAHVPVFPITHPNARQSINFNLTTADPYVT